VLLALLFLPALVAIAALLWRWSRPARLVAEAAPGVPVISGDVDPVAALDALLADLERATVRIGGADALDDDAVLELEDLADRLEATAAALERVA
jgi:hypothetical protein